MTETIGQQLKQAREAKGILLPQVVLATRIHEHYLLALEADDFNSLPSPIQARAFLRLYAEYLGLSVEDLIAHQKEAEPTLPPGQIRCPIRPKRALPLLPLQAVRLPILGQESVPRYEHISCRHWFVYGKSFPPEAPFIVHARKRTAIAC